MMSSKCWTVEIFNPQTVPSRVSGRGNIFASIRISVCVSVCALQAEPLGPTDLKFSVHIKDYHISDKFEGQGHRAKVKVTKVKNVKIPVFSLVSEKMVQGQGHGIKVTGSRSRDQGKGHKGQGCRSMSKVVVMVTGLRSKLLGEYPD